jgi:hypothetical protein
MIYSALTLEERIIVSSVNIGVGRFVKTFGHVIQSRRMTFYFRKSNILSFFRLAQN